MMPDVVGLTLRSRQANTRNIIQSLPPTQPPPRLPTDASPRAVRAWRLHLGIFLAASIVAVATVLTLIRSAQPAPGVPSTSMSSPSSAASSSRSEAASGWKTYTSEQGAYAVQYPSAWTVREAAGWGSTPNVYLEPPDGPFSWSVAIVVNDNPANRSIEQEYSFRDEVHFQPTAVDGVAAMRTLDLPGQYASDTVLVKRDHRIYKITLLKPPGKPFPLTTFERVLATFRFLNSQPTQPPASPSR